MQQDSEETDKLSDRKIKMDARNAPVIARLLELYDLGYRILCRKSGTAARIDRPDWANAMARETGALRLIRRGDPSHEHAYRSGFSCDRIIVPREIAAHMVRSDAACTGYIPRAGDKDLYERITTSLAS
jgi:hypothetical protein